MLRSRPGFMRRQEARLFPKISNLGLRAMVVGLMILSGRANHSFAQGGPPLITDDPDTPGNNKWENNIALILDATPVRKVLQSPNWDLNYGYGEHIQLNYQAGIIGQRVNGQLDETGMTQELFGVKWRFIDARSEKEGISVSTYPKYAFRGPLSSPSTDLAPTEPAWQFPIEVKIGLGDLAITTEVGRMFSSAKPIGWFYGSVVGYPASETVDLMLEIHGETDTVPRQDDWLANLGSRIKVSEQLDVITAFGRFFKTVGRAPEGLVYAGLTLHQ